jgi:hypothetical protein
MVTGDTSQSIGPIERTWAGSGTGVACSRCHRAITPADIEYEVELASPERPDRHPTTWRFHLDCYSAWQQDRRAK